MGSGKSTIGKLIAQHFNYTFIETDVLIEQSEKNTISEVFKTKGEDYFRRKETEVLHHLKLVQNSVIATGGGMPCFHSNMDIINSIGLSVWLDVNEKELIARLEKDSNNRPKISEFTSVEKTVLELLPQRKPYYQKSKIRVNNSTFNEALSAIESFMQKD